MRDAAVLPVLLAGDRHCKPALSPFPLPGSIDDALVVEATTAWTRHQLQNSV